MRGDRPQVRPTADALTEVPPAPSHLPAGMAETWHAAAADLVARRLLTTSALGALEAYIGAVWLARECRKMLARQGLTVKTQKGEPKPHPLIGTLTRTQETVTRLAAELGLTPAARSRKALQGPQGADDEFADLDL